MEGPQQEECEEAMQDELGYINTTIRLVSFLDNTIKIKKTSS